ncbi:hypothetical protein HPB47_028437 [Ixodes persulcatus]|uniref:Uncharacterized protein n=1 Tax=Ixodes persulcatus TaxID=34615 RepID=A0AC60PTL4_IXOPE|nr:hypothetical protein HPB47_028437 [Ixodes persulcatus]
MAAARGEPSGNPWELTDDALEPGSRRGGSAALHATEFRPTGAPRIAAAQEQAAADPLPQRVAGKEFAALLDSGASASLIGDEVLRHLQQKSVRVRHGETTFQLACGSTTSRGAVRLVDAGVQCSVTLDFQPRIAPGGLSQLGHKPQSLFGAPLRGGGGGGSLMVGQAGCSRTPFVPEVRPPAEVDESTGQSRFPVRPA